MLTFGKDDKFDFIIYNKVFGSTDMTNLFYIRENYSDSILCHSKNIPMKIKCLYPLITDSEIKTPDFLNKILFYRLSIW